MGVRTGKQYVEGLRAMPLNYGGSTVASMMTAESLLDTGKRRQAEADRRFRPAFETMKRVGTSNPTRKSITELAQFRSAAVAKTLRVDLSALKGLTGLTLSAGHGSAEVRDRIGLRYQAVQYVRSVGRAGRATRVPDGASRAAIFDSRFGVEGGRRRRAASARKGLRCAAGPAAHGNR